MNVDIVRINLRYELADLELLFRYASAHDVERNGRYDIRKPPCLNIWTHTWLNPGCKAESSLMFALEFDRNTASLMLVLLQPGYDWMGLFFRQQKALPGGANLERAEAKAEPSHSRFTSGKLYAAAPLPSSRPIAFSNFPCPS
jgi:hypothetical protein